MPLISRENGDYFGGVGENGGDGGGEGEDEAVLEEVWIFGGDDEIVDVDYVGFCVFAGGFDDFGIGWGVIWVLKKCNNCKILEKVLQLLKDKLMWSTPIRSMIAAFLAIAITA